MLPRARLAVPLALALVVSVFFMWSSAASVSLFSAPPASPCAVSPALLPLSAEDASEPPTMDTVLVKRLSKLEAQLKASEEANAKLRMDVSGALKEENRGLKAGVAFAEDLAYYSMKLWSEAASRRAWEEYDCHGPPDNGSSSLAAARAWQGFGRLQPRCGCIRAPEEVEFTPQTCTGEPRDATACARKTPWVLFAGDSTMRQLFEQSQDALSAVYACSDPALKNKTATTLHSARDDEARFTMWKRQGSAYLHEWDSDLVCLDRASGQPVMVLSYRSHQGLSPSSKMLSMLRRPHTHRVTASIMPKGWFFNTILPVLDEPYFVEVPWVVERALGVPDTLAQQTCGPDHMLVGSALWDTSNWLGSVEAERCGMQGAKGTSEELFPRRVAAALNEACRRFGNAGRFVWRTSNRGNGRFKRLPGLNQVAVAMARRAGFKVLDYESLHASVGYVIRDHAHPPNFLTMRGAQAFWRYVGASRLAPRATDVAANVLAVIAERLPQTADQWTSKAAMQKLATDEEARAEAAGDAPWSVK